MLCDCFIADHILPASAVNMPPNPSTAMTAWNWELWILIPLVVAALCYGVGSVRARVRSIARWQATAFWFGWLTLFVSLISPLHKVSSALFFVHMTQHELIMRIAAPLMVMGRPLIAFVWALPLRWRQAIGHFFARPVVSKSWKQLSTPLVAWTLHAVALWMWHAPALYSAAIADERIHAVQHSMFLFTALLFWWTVIHGRYGRMGYGMAIVYVFTTSLHSGLLGALFTLADRTWFRIHEGRTSPWGFTAIEDQQLAGLIMWIPAGVIFIVAGLALFAAWLGESERRFSYSRLASLGGHDKAQGRE
jgi:putative membrane protein